MPDPDHPDAVVLHVCTTCKVAGQGGDKPAGSRLLDALQAELDRAPMPGLTVEGVPCLSVCKRPCTVAVASAGRWSYVYGDLDAEASARTILDGLAAYAATPDGIVAWRERPVEFRRGVIARIPPLPAARTDDI